MAFHEIWFKTVCSPKVKDIYICFKQFQIITIWVLFSQFCSFHVVLEFCSTFFQLRGIFFCSLLLSLSFSFTFSLTETFNQRSEAVSVTLQKYLCLANYRIHRVDATLTGDHRPASNHYRLLRKRSLLYAPSARSQHCFLCSPCFMKTLLLFCLSLFDLLKCSCLLLPCGLFPIMNALYDIKSAVCAGLSLRSVVLILSIRGQPCPRFQFCGETILCRYFFSPSSFCHAGNDSFFQALCAFHNEYKTCCFT